MATPTNDKSRVLVVDDEPQITRVLRTVLTSQGYQVQTAGEGQAALANFNEWHPELVITDLFMPRMDGLEATKRLRTICPETHVIVLSGLDEDDVAQQAREAGAHAYLQKGKAHEHVVAAIHAARAPVG